MADELKSKKPDLGKRGLLGRLALLGLGGAAVVAGLTVEGVPTAQAQGYPPLPPPRYEQIPPPPGGQFAWQPGHWRWNGYRYVWFPGRYIPGGPHFAHFIPGHWALRYGQWVWIPQHWR